jgi:hypothetical protein
MTAQIKPARHPLHARRDDLYPTHPAAVRALLAVERLPRPPRRIWEPGAGRGAIVDVLRAEGYEVVASDFIDYGVPEQNARWDFLMELRLPGDVDVILTNPPFKLATAFVEHALVLCPCVIMLLRTLFLESQGRRELLQRHLARVHIFSDRIPDMHRDGWSGKRANPFLNLAWFVFERERAQQGSALVDWILADAARSS